jgi:hypothetical protein
VDPKYASVYCNFNFRYLNPPKSCDARTNYCAQGFNAFAYTVLVGQLMARATPHAFVLVPIVSKLTPARLVCDISFAEESHEATRMKSSDGACIDVGDGGTHGS